MAPDRLHSFVSELRRRRVVGVAVLYVGVSWVLVKVASELEPALYLPPWTDTLLLVLALLGLPLVLLASWAFDLTAHGISRTPPAAAAATAAPRLSIVVLPFDNLSPDPTDSYFSDGLTEEVIATLSRLRPLSVISRSSAMAFKGTRKDLRTIARELDVAYALEGSVRKSGNSLRITAQLIDATTDRHLWAEHYDGELNDVFSFQERVARAIAGSLRIELGAGDQESIRARTVEDPVAYECYLRARVALWFPTEAAIDDAIALVEQGLSLLPANERLVSMKAMLLLQYVNTLSKDPGTYAELLEEARELAASVCRSNPRSADGVWAAALVDFQRGEITASARGGLRALELDPSSEATLVLGWQALVTAADADTAARFWAAGTRRDPLSPLFRHMADFTLVFEGRFAEALERYAPFQAQLLRGGSPFALWGAWMQALNGDAEAARMTLDTLSTRSNATVQAFCAFLSNAWRGERDAALAAVTPGLEAAAWWDDTWPLLTAEAYATIGERDQALHWLGHAVDFGLAHPRFLEQHDPLLATLRDDARFAPLMQRAREQAARMRAVLGSA